MLSFACIQFIFFLLLISLIDFLACVIIQWNDFFLSQMAKLASMHTFYATLRRYNFFPWFSFPFIFLTLIPTPPGPLFKGRYSSSCLLAFFNKASLVYLTMPSEHTLFWDLREKKCQEVLLKLRTWKKNGGRWFLSTFLDRARQNLSIHYKPLIYILSLSIWTDFVCQIWLEVNWMRLTIF